MQVKFLVLIIAIAGLTSCGNGMEENPVIEPEWCGMPPGYDSYRWLAYIYPKNSKLKRIYQVDYNYVFVQMLTQYEYDESGKIIKTFFPGNEKMYDDYEYDGKGQLSSISKYDNNVLRQITSYFYDESGKKIKEQIENRSDGTVLYGISYTLFIYDRDRLVKTEKYYKNALKYYIRYEYNDANELIKEKLFVPGDDSYVTTEHTYAEGLLIFSVSYSNDDRKNGFMFDSRRYYDLNDNMTKIIYNTPGLSSTISFDGKPKAFLERRIYEYYE
jgi:hypothetical protein